MKNNKVYLVNIDSDVVAAFLDLELAKKFKLYHNYDHIEEIEISLEAPKCDKLGYVCNFNLNNESIKVERLDTDFVKDKDGQLSYHGNIITADVAIYSNSIRLYILAKDEQSARETFQDIIVPILNGKQIIKDHKNNEYKIIGNQVVKR